jgi:hypothetical protein
MKRVAGVFGIFFILCLVSLPPGAAFLQRENLPEGFSAGLFTDHLLTGNACAASAPDTPPPPGAPPPPGQPGPGGSAVSPPPPPGPEARCREWKMVDRRMESRYDRGLWQQVPVERWDWVDVPCSRPETASTSPGLPPPASALPPPMPPPEVNVPPPPPYEFPAPPSVAVIPGTYAYVVPGVDIAFYRGYWYRPYGGRWFWATSYNGPWVYLPPPGVPRVLLILPPGYYRVPHGYPIIPYARFHANWGKWERERYWHGHREWHEGWHHR